jgi:hypothetical protein
MPVNSYEPPGKAATEYLLKRQKKHTAKGAFGRFSVSRSGEEIVPSFRHTALACLTLMAMNGPPSAVLEGIRYLVSMTVDDLRDDAAPSIACAASLLALECAASSAWGEQHLPRKDVDRVKEVLNDHRADLMLALESEARSPTTYAPLWEPYAHRGRMIYDSALTTLDLLTLLTDPPWNIVVAALYHLARGKMELGLPYDPSLDKPDVGISAYFATICRRGPVLQRLRTTEGEDSILSAADDCIDFVLKEWGNPIYMERTYCDTVANGLLLKLGDYGIRDLSSVL